MSKSHPELTGDARERIMSSYFTRGLVDDRVRDVVSATPEISSQEALRRASAMASSRRKGVGGGPPPRRLPKDQLKESASSYSTSFASQSARGVRFDPESYYQSVKNVGVETEEQKEGPEGPSAGSTDVAQPDEGAAWLNEGEQFAQFRETYRGG